MATLRYYNEVMRADMKTGDIILFSGKGGASAGIKWATFSRWSHVGMVVLLPEYDLVAVWESCTVSTLSDIDTGARNKGVQLVPLSTRIDQYDGDVAVRRLSGVEFSTADIRSLVQLRRELAGRKYEKDELELLKAAWDYSLGRNQEDLSSLFCSELVAEAYQRLGLLDGNKPSNEYIPADFSEKRTLPLLRGTLGPEMFIKTAS
jgi:Permuted papain-like amidase enzyme, YaeF/YiiX, C92 family